MKAFDLLFGNVPARFPSAFSLSESVDRLQANTKRHILSSLFRQSAVGPVSEGLVRLQRVIPLVGNSFKPIFVGAFRVSEGQVVLEGKFTMFRFSKVFMTFWLAFSLLWSFVAISLGLKPMPMATEQTEHIHTLVSLLFPFAGIIMFFVGIVFVRVCWRLSRGDIGYLSRVIAGALSGGMQNQ